MSVAIAQIIGRELNGEPLGSGKYAARHIEVNVLALKPENHLIDIGLPDWMRWVAGAPKAAVPTTRLRIKNPCPIKDAAVPDYLVFNLAESDLAPDPRISLPVGTCVVAVETVAAVGGIPVLVTCQIPSFAE